MVQYYGILNNSSNKTDNLKAFYIKRGDVLALQKGVWHSVPMPVKEECKLLVVFATGAPDRDMELKRLDGKVKIIY